MIPHGSCSTTVYRKKWETVFGERKPTARMWIRKFFDFSAINFDQYLGMHATGLDSITVFLHSFIRHTQQGGAASVHSTPEMCEMPQAELRSSAGPGANIRCKQRSKHCHPCHGSMVTGKSRSSQ